MQLGCGDRWVLGALGFGPEFGIWVFPRVRLAGVEGAGGRIRFVVHVQLPGRVGVRCSLWGIFAGKASIILPDFECALECADERMLVDCEQVSSGFVAMVDW